MGCSISLHGTLTPPAIQLFGCSSVIVASDRIDSTRVETAREITNGQHEMMLVGRPRHFFEQQGVDRPVLSDLDVSFGDRIIIAVAFGQDKGSSFLLRAAHSEALLRFGGSRQHSRPATAQAFQMTNLCFLNLSFLLFSCLQSSG